MHTMPSESWSRWMTFSRRRIYLLLLAGVFILAISIYLEGSGYTNLTSLPWPTLSQSSADLTSSTALSELFLPTEEDRSWMAENDRTIASIFRCAEQGNCSGNQTKVVILAGGPFRGVLRGDNSGEAIWANSTVRALRSLGYSLLYSTGKKEQMSQLYSMFRHLVVAVLADTSDIKECFHDRDCVLMENNPRGIPAWKLFSFHFWGSADNPLGRKWTLSPEPWKDSYNTYLGYSIEPQCARQTFVPHDARPAQAFVYSKDVKNFQGGEYAWAHDFFDAASAAAGVEFIAGVKQDLPEFFPNITNVGFMPQTEFYETIARSKVVVGIGRPITSPTAYDALCFGVPFINPILGWDKNRPSDKTRWNSQHNTLKHLDPPYVYNVFRDDKEGFVNAVVQATSTPIESFVLPAMRMSAVEVRMAKILATDWRAEAAELLADRKASRVGETFWL
ncbi:hypothetical protein MSAN_00959400 [Mycena sanguinolenta]|uniref:Glycosyltransferase family 18 catalytic domain-containing protein n=1 Tax=Mycena sanguinolenta TaxID=230812 RepID=A0A8H6YTR2_9AGAR|nr:hypothetical protein MSAN_00959400 [Mycena sanguinolenta]